MPDKSPRHHLHESYKYFREAEDFNNEVARTRAVWHILAGIFLLLEQRCNADS